MPTRYRVITKRKDTGEIVNTGGWLGNKICAQEIQDALTTQCPNYEHILEIEDDVF